MAKYIEIDETYNVLTDYYHHTTEAQHKALRDALNRVPVADVVKVVRCKDCRYFNKTFPLLHMCNLSCMKMEIDDYCSYGERKDEE